MAGRSAVAASPAVGSRVSAAAQMALSLQRMDGREMPQMQYKYKFNRQDAENAKIKAERF